VQSHPGHGGGDAPDYLAEVQRVGVIESLRWKRSPGGVSGAY